MSRHMVSRRNVLLGGVALSGFVAAPAILRAEAAPISVGFVTGQTGPGASIGIPYSRGIAAAMAYLDTIEGHKIRRRRKGRHADRDLGPSGIRRNGCGRRRAEGAVRFDLAAAADGRAR